MTEKQFKKLIDTVEAATFFLCTALTGHFGAACAAILVLVVATGEKK